MAADIEYHSCAEDEDIYDIKPFNLYEKIIDKKDENVFIIKLGFRELLVYTDNWCYNRSISDAKVEELYTSLCEAYTLPFILQAVYDERHSNPIAKLLILDGQHRKEAVRKFIETNDVSMECEHHVWICVYKINNSETDNTNMVIDLFKKINNNRVFSEKELPDTFIVDLVKSICNISGFKRKGVIKINDSHSKAHAPFIHKKELNCLLNQNQDMIRSSGKTIAELTNNIQVINHKISLKKYEELYSVANKSLETARYQKAVSKNFFLNLKNSKFPPEVWIKYIIEPSVI
jgi:hypothetical protein